MQRVAAEEGVVLLLLDALRDGLLVALGEVARGGFALFLGFGAFQGSSETLTSQCQPSGGRDDLEGIIGTFDIHVVQAPLNVFDRRILGVTDQLLALNIEVHARSVFLQGVLIASPKDRPQRFEPWSEHFALFDEWVHSSGVSAMACCMGFALQQPGIAKLVIGTTSAESLDEIMNSIPNSVLEVPTHLQSSVEQLIDPRFWNAA